MLCVCVLLSVAASCSSAGVKVMMSKQTFAGFEMYCRLALYFGGVGEVHVG
jgi:hypothetical protein